MSYKHTVVPCDSEKCAGMTMVDRQPGLSKRIRMRGCVNGRIGGRAAELLTYGRAVPRGRHIIGGC